MNGLSIRRLSAPDYWWAGCHWSNGFAFHFHNWAVVWNWGRR